MRLRQLDLVGGIYLADGRESKLLTGIDDHSRFVRAELARLSVPFEVLTDTARLTKRCPETAHVII
jgi:hypothetical protein